MAKIYRPPNQRKLLQAYINWAQEREWQIEFSPNFQPGITRERAQKTLSQFWHHMNRQVFGCRRNGEPNATIKRMCFIEGDGHNLQVHYHCAVQLPPLRDGTESDENKAERIIRFCARLNRAWEQFSAAGHFTSCAPIRSLDGFTVYICKKSLSDSFCGMTSEL